MQLSDYFKKLGFLIAVVTFGFAPLAAQANHSWGGYHWARTSNPFTVKLGDNVSAQWDSYLATTSSDWSASSVLNTEIVAGQVNPKNCRPTLGRIEVCNSKYGSNDWLGIASVWVTSSHITQGTVKMNDTYFNTASYNTPAWRNLVMCQEVGHTFGLDHQDENFTNANLGTCMDYTNNPASNQYPNAHDYEELEAIYAHLDTFTTIGQTTQGASGATPAHLDLDNASEWGQAIHISGSGKPSLYVKDLKNNTKVFTFVVWAE